MTRISRNAKDYSGFRTTSSQELCLDIFRVMAAEYVVLFHFFHLTQHEGWAARLPLHGFPVTAFFLLSGFLIFLTTWRKREQDYSLREYLIDRSARLWVCLVPALILSVVVAAMVIDLPEYPASRNTGPVHFLGNLLMLGDYPLFQILRRLGIDSELFVRPYASAEPYWTLPIEFWLYVAFGFAFFRIYLGRQGTVRLGVLLVALAILPVIYHAAAGYGQSLTLIWLLGCAGPFALSADHAVQRRFELSDRATIVVIVTWIALFAVLLTLRGLSRQLNFYEFQTALFLAGLMIGFLWLTGRVNIDRLPAISAVIRTLSRQSYALYLTHNAVITYHIATTGPEFDLTEAVLLVCMCNVIGMVFYWLFDRHQKQIARKLKSSQVGVFGTARQS